MPHTTRTGWNNARHWPIAYRTQADADLPPGPIHDAAPITRWQHLCFGALIGLLIIGPALADLWGAL